MRKLILSTFVFIFMIQIAVAQRAPSLRESEIAHANQVYQLILAEMAVDRQQWGTAIGIYSYLAKSTKNNLIFSRANQLALALQANEVLWDLTHAWMKSLPDSLEAKINYAKVLATRGKYKEALAELDSLPPTKLYHDDVTFLRALTAIQMKDYLTAKHLLLAIKESKFKDQVAYFMGSMADVDHQPHEALSWYKRVAFGPHLFPAQLRSVMILFKQGHAKEALSIVQKMQPANPEQEQTVLTIKAEIEIHLNNTDVALKTLNKALAKYPSNYSLRYLRGILYANLRRLQPAETDFRYILKHDPHNTETLNALGYTLIDLSDRYKEAQPYIEKAYKQSPRSAVVLDTIGWLNFKLGQFQKAEKFLGKAYKIEPYPDIAAHYAEVLLKRKKKKQAIQVVEESLKRYPNNKLLKSLLKRMKK